MSHEKPLFDKNIILIEPVNPLPAQSGSALFTPGNMIYLILHKWI